MALVLNIIWRTEEAMEEYFRFPNVGVYFLRFPNGANAILHINGQRVHALLLGIRNCK